MISKTITFVDYDGNERTEEFRFNISKAELIEMEMDTPGGMEQHLNGIIAAQDRGKIMKMFRDLILKSYGKKSADGKYFEKSEELSKAFTQTEAYSVLLMEFCTDAGKAADFVNGIIPKLTTADRTANQVANKLGIVPTQPEA